MNLKVDGFKSTEELLREELTDVRRIAREGVEVFEKRLLEYRDEVSSLRSERDEAREWLRRWSEGELPAGYISATAKALGRHPSDKRSTTKYYGVIHSHEKTLVVQGENFTETLAEVHGPSPEARESMAHVIVKALRWFHG